MLHEKTDVLKVAATNSRSESNQQDTNYVQKNSSANGVVTDDREVYDILSLKMLSIFLLRSPCSDL